MANLKKAKKQPRLHSAVDWVKTYNGKNIVKGYSRHYGVDLLCAIKELRILGAEIKEEYEIAVKRSLADRAFQKKKRKLELAKHTDMLGNDSDHNFAFIAGYTSGGAPYGITWQEMENDNAESMCTVVEFLKEDL